MFVLYLVAWFVCDGMKEYVVWGVGRSAFLSEI